MDNRKSTKRPRNSKKSSSPPNKRRRNNRPSPATKSPYGYYDVQYGPLFAQLSYKPKIQGFTTPRYSMNTQPSAIIVKSLEIPENSGQRRKGYGRKFMEAMFNYGKGANQNIILELTITPQQPGLSQSAQAYEHKRKMVDDPIVFFV
eukprot:6185015-Pleurochrysis_carterae.AAC.1